MPTTSQDAGIVAPAAPPRPARRAHAWLAALMLALGQLACETPPASSTPPPDVAAAQRPAGQANLPTSRQSAPSAPVTPAASDRYDLERDEARGGHTLARHVGRSDADLKERLRREPRISGASTYTDRATAERIVARTLTRQRSRVDQWLARSGSRPNLALDYRGDKRETIGRSLTRRSVQPAACSDAVVVLRWDGRRGFIVLTSYPEISR